MRNYHNTAGEYKKPPRTNTNSAERNTMTGGHYVSHVRSKEQPMSHEQMANFITQTMLKIPSQNSRSSLTGYLKGNQKILYSTIGSLMRVIDRSFEDSILDPETVINIMKFWGYQVNIHKTVFMPVGAPHTWGACLGMLYYLADITNFFFEYRSQLEEGDFDASYSDIEFKVL